MTKTCRASSLASRPFKTSRMRCRSRSAWERNGLARSSIAKPRLKVEIANSSNVWIIYLPSEIQEVHKILNRTKIGSLRKTLVEPSLKSTARVQTRWLTRARIRKQGTTTSRTPRWWRLHRWSSNTSSLTRLRKDSTASLILTNHRMTRDKGQSRKSRRLKSCWIRRLTRICVITICRFRRTSFSSSDNRWWPIMMLESIFATPYWTNRKINKIMDKLQRVSSIFRSVKIPSPANQWAAATFSEWYCRIKNHTSRVLRKNWIMMQKRIRNKRATIMSIRLMKVAFCQNWLWIKK